MSAARPSPAGSGMRYAAVNGTRLAYTEQGEGEAVICVHGSLGDYRSWAFQMGPFSERYRVISYSRRYHHPNPEDGRGAPYTAQVHAADLAGLIGALGIERAHIVASSYGGLVGLELGKDYPALVGTLVLGEAAIVHWLRGKPEGLFERWIGEVRPQVAQAFAIGNLEGAVALKAQLEAPFQDLSCEDARRVAVPSLILDGERSQTMFRLGNDELQQCLPRNERMIVPNAGHVMQASNPSAYNRIVLSFLAEHPLTKKW
jgi:pimeloyl-ACP methyl ester carboxylesterase